MIVYNPIDGKEMMKEEMIMHVKNHLEADIVIVGTGCSGLYCALQLPRNRKIILITKSNVESSDSYLAQGGICMLKNEEDYDSYFEDTLKAGHYENDRESVDIMIRSSQDVVKDLISYEVDFKRNEDGSLTFTKEGCHSDARILYHEDITGKEITSHLYEQVKSLSNVEILEYTTMVDIVEKENTCYGVVVKQDSDYFVIHANYTVWASGGVGGLYQHSTNYKHLTGDALAIALNHNVELENIDYIQIHPTTLFNTKVEDRSFLISESVRGEGAKLYDKNMNRFVDELLPRDVVTNRIHEQMEIDGTEFVWEDLRTIPKNELLSHFPNIVQTCKDAGYDVTKECIPIVPAQHYFMGGVKVNHSSKTSMNQLYAVGETACNGVHGKNRLASNSLLESLVFAKRAAKEIGNQFEASKKDLTAVNEIDYSKYEDYEKLLHDYKEAILTEMDREKEMKACLIQ